ncbi:MAG TPA: serine hydrolase domain-containing protein [Acidimicrobiales bacterium]|nr:serine hydrolase domain-containing protein [Acidimicrobiales bacterium]
MSTGGIHTDRIDALLERARREIDAGLLPSCQVALARDGELLVFEALGDATTDTRYNVFSATKPFVAGVMWTLIGEGAVDPATRVAEIVPEFGTNGKDVITIEQVMLHTSGFPAAPLGPPAWATREGRLEVFARWRLNWEPGTRYEYHPTSAHWVLAEIIDRVTGADYRDEVQRRITDPMGLPRVLGIGPDVAVAELRTAGEEATPAELREAFGVDELPATEVTDAALLGFNHPAAREVGVPGGGGVMRAADLALFHQNLLDDRAGIWDPAIRRDVTTRVRNLLPDPFTGVPANRTLGLVLAGDDGKANMRGFGHTCSPMTFGHNGAAGQVAWADPATGLSFAYVTNGIDVNVVRQPRRGIALSSIAATCADPR